MNRPVALAVMAILLGIPALAQKAKTPQFSDLPAVVEKARVKTIDFKRNPDARSFRTRLSEALKEGVNFAGHFVVTGWGCGTGCVSGAIIDARTGNVFWPEQFHDIGVWYDENTYTDKPVDYRKNSRLFVVNGSPGTKEGEADKPQGTYYYEWKNNHLRLIKVAARKAG